MRTIILIWLVLGVVVFGSSVDVAVSHLTKVEGFRSSKYWDVNRYSIGYGTPALKGDTKISQKVAEARLKTRATAISQYLDREIRVKLTDSQKASLISFVYNVGESAFKRSTVRKLVNAGKLTAVPVELRKWVYVGKTVNNGLKVRREKEVVLWNAP